MFLSPFFCLTFLVTNYILLKIMIIILILTSISIMCLITIAWPLFYHTKLTLLQSFYCLISFLHFFYQYFIIFISPKGRGNWTIIYLHLLVSVLTISLPSTFSSSTFPYTTKLNLKLKLDNQEIAPKTVSSISLFPVYALVLNLTHRLYPLSITCTYSNYFTYQ